MAPKVKITKEDIIHAAVEIVRQQGAAAVNARTVAAELSCSTQPVFSNFPTMEELRLAVQLRAEAMYSDFSDRETARSSFPAYKAQGIAYIRFAKEERELFKLLFMRDRKGEDTDREARYFDQVVGNVRQLTGMEQETATLFHLEMWAYVHGIAAMFATNYLDLEQELVSRMLTDAYMGLRKQYGLEG